ncbi:MAG: 2-phosphosulfolactate phosphatase [Desulfatiglandaceae bacterium]
MEITLHSLKSGAENARGTVVIVDVFRAFTVAPILLHLGVREIRLVASPAEGLALKSSDPELILVGEVDGVPIDGFDFGNSPTEIIRKNKSFFLDKRAAQRTSAGVQGALIALDHADEVLAASFVTASATAARIRRMAPERVSIVAMGKNMEKQAPEDESCARCIAALLREDEYDHFRAVRKILLDPAIGRFTDGTRPYLPAEDPALCLQLNLFPFVVKVEKDDGGVFARKERMES